VTKEEAEQPFVVWLGEVQERQGKHKTMVAT
jgi:hypothetical protein